MGPQLAKISILPGFQLFSQHDVPKRIFYHSSKAADVFVEAWWPAHTAAGFLCAGGRCFTFDSSAQGHVRQRRGEGFAALKEDSGKGMMAKGV